MDQKRLEELLASVAGGSVPPSEAVEALRNLPYEDLGFAKIDHHRQLRKGYPETIFCEGKTADDVVAIVGRMQDHGGNVFGTRCSEETAAQVVAAFPDVTHHARARAFSLITHPPEPMEGYVAVVCAGTSDIPVAEEACVTCEVMGCPVERVYDVGVAGIHRVLQQRPILEEARAIIVCAGMEGALPSVVGGLVNCPLIGVPTSIGYGASFGGVSALLGMLNSCSAGLTVVNIDNGFGAAVAACNINRILNGR
jgi:pyridinium-3,5-biscarboxylic acid mononucleotide synthase